MEFLEKIMEFLEKIDKEWLMAINICIGNRCKVEPGGKGAVYGKIYKSPANI